MPGINEPPKEIIKAKVTDVETGFQQCEESEFGESARWYSKQSIEATEFSLAVWS